MSPSHDTRRSDLHWWTVRLLLLRHPATGSNRTYLEVSRQLGFAMELMRRAGREEMREEETTEEKARMFV